MGREKERRVEIIVGLFVLLMIGVLVVSFFLVGQSTGTWKAKTTISTDFKTITGLREGSPVEIAGVQAGTVKGLAFKRVSYECDFASEDLGRHGLTRTDNCDPFLFCSPEGLCADLEPYASKELHPPCLTSSDCAEAEICVTKELRRRYRRTAWAGPDSVCARYNTEHQRVRVTMEVFSERLELIRTDSRATVAQNGVLGDQLVAITPGMQDPIAPGGRIQSEPSLFEDIRLFRDRVEGLTEKVDSSLAGISNLFSALNDENTLDNVKGTLANVNQVTGQIAAGEGLVGALLRDRRYVEDVSLTLRHIRETASGLESFVERANGTLAKADDSFQPLVDDARASMASIKVFVDRLSDPKNQGLVGKLLGDDKLAKDVQETVAHLNAIAAKIEAGQGTLGKLVNDSKPHDDLVKFMGNLNRNKTWKLLTRRVMQMGEKMDAGRPPAESTKPEPQE